MRLIPIVSCIALICCAAPARRAAAATAPRSASRPATAAPAPAHPKAYFRRPTEGEWLRFHAELRKSGWENVQVATVSPGYLYSAGTVRGLEPQFATFYGDVDGDRRAEWVIGCYLNDEPPPLPRGAPRLLPQDDRARVVVFKKDASGRWAIHWRSHGLGHEFSEPRFNLEEVENGLDRVENLLLPLSLIDVDGDRRLDIAYHCRSQAADAGDLPGVLRFDGARWVSVAPQADRFSLQDVDGDGKLEAVTGSRRIGSGTGDDDVPRVWRWSGQLRRYEEASNDFPRFYAGLVARYQSFVRRKQEMGQEIDRSIWERAIQKATSMSG